MTQEIERPKRRKQIKLSALTNALLVKHLADGVHNCRELAEITGLHYMTVLEYTRALHHVGAAHICTWDKDSRGRDVVKIYRLGQGKDAKRERMTPAQRQARRRAKLKNIELINRLAA